MTKESTPTQMLDMTPEQEERHESHEIHLEHAAAFISDETGVVEEAAHKIAQKEDQKLFDRFRNRALRRVAITGIALASVVGLEGRKAEAGEGAKRKAAAIGIVVAHETERAMYEAEYRAILEANDAEQAFRKFERRADDLAVRYEALAREVIRLDEQAKMAEERNDARTVRKILERKMAVRDEQAMIQGEIATLEQMQEEAYGAHQEAMKEARKKGKIRTGARIAKGVLDILRR